MKISRSLLIVAGSLLGLAVVVVALAFTPAFQRWVVLRATASTPGLKLELARVSAGLSSVELRDVRVKKDGLVVEFTSLDARYSLFDFVLGQRLNIERLQVEGVVIDATQLDSAAQAASAGAPAAAPGVLAHIQLPFELTLNGVQVSGQARLPTAEAGTTSGLVADFTLSGGGFAPGRPGELTVVGTVKNPAAGASVTALNARLTLQATQTAERGFNQIKVTAVLDAEGRGLAGQTQLKVAADLLRDAAGENYSVKVDTLIEGTAENVLALQALLPVGEKQFSGQWTLKARKAQLAPFFLGGILPEFTTHGTGRFRFAPSPLALSLQGALDTAVSQLELVDPAWRAFGAVQTSVVFDVEALERVAKLNQLKVSVTGANPVLQLEALNAAEFDFAQGRLQVGGAGVSEVLDFRLQGLPVAWVRPFVPEVDVSGGEITGRFSVASEGGRLFVRSPEPLKISALNVVKQGVLLLAKADVRLRPEFVLAPTELQATVRDFDFRTAAGDSLTAEFSATLPVSLRPPLVVTGRYSADLPTLLAAWVPLGRIKSSGTIDATVQSEAVDVRQVSATVTDGAGGLFFKAETLRAFTLNLLTDEAVTGETGSTDLLKITTGELSLDKVPLSQAGMRLSGTLTAGEFRLAAAGSKLTLSAVKPVKLDAVGLRQNEQVTLTGLTIQAQPVVEILAGGTVSAKSGEVTVTNAKGAVLVSLQGDVSRSAKDGTRAAMTFTVDVPALGSQPAFAGAQAVTQGKASGEIRAASGVAHQVEARMTVNGLVARDLGQTLPIANLSLRALVEPSGKLLLQAPLLLDRAGQRSDLNFTLELLPTGETFAMSGKLSSEHIELADALAMLGLFQAAPPTNAKAPSAPTATNPRSGALVVADLQPPWARVTGQFLLDIKSVAQGKSWSMTGLTGVIDVDPTQLTLAKLQAVFDEKSQLSAQAKLGFSPGGRPYQLGATFTLSEFDAGKLFKAFDPAKAPTVEGLFNVSGALRGDGETIARTVERTRGDFELKSRQGVFRGLQRTAGKLSVTSKAVELGASVLGSIFGSEKATRTAEKIAGQAYFVDQLAQTLAELNYDQLTVKLSRDDALNVTIPEISLVAPELRLVGKGSLVHVDGKSLLDYPLTATLALSSRGKIEEVLAKLSVTDTTKDELGFTRSREVVTLGGTLGRPDATPFFAKLGTKLATDKLGDFLAPTN